MLTFRYWIGASCLAMLIAAGCCEESTTVPAGSAPPPAAAAPAPPVKTYDYTQKVLDGAKRRAGRKWTVAILRFCDTKEVEGVPFGAASQPAGTQAGQVAVNVKVGDDHSAAATETPPQMNTRAREILKNAMVKSDAFTVVERERILDILREINFAKTKYVNPDTAPEEGALLSVKYLIEGSMGYNEDKTLKDNLDGGKTYKDAADCQAGVFDNIFNPGKVNREKMMIALRRAQAERQSNRARAEFHIACYLSVYDVHTGTVVTTVMGLGSNGLEAISDAVDELIESMSALDADVHVATAGEGRIYLDVGSNGGVKMGDRFEVVHQGQAIRDKDGQLIGYEEHEVGEIVVTEVRPLLSVAKIVNKTGDLARGDLAKPAKH